MAFLHWLIGPRAPRIEPRLSFGINKRHAYWCENPLCAYVVVLSPGETECPECHGRVLTSVHAMHATIEARARQSLKVQEQLRRAGLKNDVSTLTEFRSET